MQLRRVSASQVSGFQRCQRYWYYGWVEKIKGPQTPAMKRGSDIHAEIEHWFKTGHVRDSDYGGLNYRPYVEAAMEHLPDPSIAKELLIEQAITVPCGNGIDWIGFIDVLHCDRTPLLVLDNKTTSDFRYAKTPEQLRENTQLNSYAKYVYEMGYEGIIQLAHLSIKTNAKKVPKKPKTKLVNVLTDREQVDLIWARDMETVKKMATVAACVTSAHDLPPTTSACGMYGGCQHREKCGLVMSDFMKAGTGKRTTKEGKKKMASFVERLKQKQSGNGTNGKSKATSVPDVAADKPDGVLAADAPDRETVVKTEEEIAAEKALAEAQATAKKAAAKAEKARKAADKKAAKGTKKKKSSTTPGLHLFIDCMPIKDVDGNDIDPTLFEDWIGPVVEGLNEQAQKDMDLADYRLLPYAQEKAAFHAAVEARIENLPPAIIVNTGTPGSKDALAILIPHATRVTRGMR